MKPVFRRLRTFSLNLGLVEQAQMVASTAVVVIMVTIISASIILNKIITWFDFISVITVGVIGFASVYFSLKYGRQLEEQKRELVALNTVAEAAMRTIDLESLLSDVLQKVAALARARYGWIYLSEGKGVALKRIAGAEFDFFAPPVHEDITSVGWLQEIHAERLVSGRAPDYVGPEAREAGIESWVSVPLKFADQFAGLLLLAGTEASSFTERQVDLVSAFGNHISFALNNAYLFDRLRKSEQQYADLFEHSPDMYHLVNRDGIIISCNQTEAQTLLYEKSAIIGHHLQALYPPSYHENIRTMLADAFESNRETRGAEEQMLKRDGSVIEVSLNTSLVYDEGGKPVLLRCVLRDITEKKKMEEKIMQAQKIDSIGNLAGGVAHDFNNILASILGSASIMRRRMKVRDRWYPFVDIIETAAKRGASLTRQLLTFARRSNVEIHPIDVHAILEETIHLFERSVNPNIAVEKNFTDDPAAVNGDEGQIQQAFLNILINARDAMPGGGTITITTTCADLSGTDGIGLMGDVRSGPHVAVQITDSGHGMGRETLQRIFEPFFTTKEHGKGTGLGLSVVYGVVKTHGGHVAVQSEPGAGTTFTVYLPRLTGRYRIRPKMEAQKIPGGTESVLVVDDEEIVCATITNMLTDLGYTVTAAHSGEEALEILQDGEARFALVILDMTMPGMDGKSVYEKIRRLDADVRVIISSGYSDSILGERSFARTVDGFIQKPYQIEDLALKVRSVLDRTDERS